MTTTVSAKGQITIPKNLRDQLGLPPGTVIRFEADHGVLVGRKVMREDPFLAWKGKGVLPKNMTVDEYLNVVRDGNAHSS